MSMSELAVLLLAVAVLLGICSNLACAAVSLPMAPLAVASAQPDWLPSASAQKLPPDARLRLKRSFCELSTEHTEDGFCDCLLPTTAAELPDELDTGSCGFGAFRCRNLGYVPTPLPWSMVGDGVCDCCDGSDEAEEAVAAFRLAQAAGHAEGADKEGESWSPAVSCPNRCEAEAETVQGRLERRLENHRQGAKKRQMLIRRSFQVQPEWWEVIADQAGDLEHTRLEGIQIQQQLKQLHERLQVEQHQAVQIAQERSKMDLEPEEPSEQLLQLQQEFQQLHEYSQSHRQAFRGQALRWHGLMLVVGQPSETWLEQREQGVPRRLGLVPDLRKAHPEELNNLAMAGLIGQCFNGLYTQTRYDAEWAQISDRYVIRLCPLLNVTQFAVSEADHLALLAKADTPESWVLPVEGRSWSLGFWSGWEEANLLAEQRLAWWQAQQDAGQVEEIPDQVQPSFDLELVFRARYVGGDPCWRSPPRQASVRMVCGPSTRLREVQENGSCNFVLDLETPAGCLPEAEGRMQHELRLLQLVREGRGYEEAAGLLENEIKEIAQQKQQQKPAERQEPRRASKKPHQPKSEL